MSIIKLTKENFEENISKGVTLVDFWATWCPPCQVQGPILDKLSTTLNSDTKIGKVDVDEQRDLANQYGIRSIPTLILFKDGKVIENMVGVQMENALKNKINKLD